MIAASSTAYQAVSRARIGSLTSDSSMKPTPRTVRISRRRRNGRSSFLRR